MSIRIRIDDVEHDLAQADEHWVISQIEQRKRDNGRVCVQILIKENGLDLCLSSADCARSGGGGRQATKREKDVLELWKRAGFGEGQIVGGRVIAFLKQLRRVV